MACELIPAIRYDANFKGKLQLILIWNTKKGTSCLRTQGFPGINRSLIPGMSGITLRLARWRETLPGAPGLLRALGRRSCRGKLGLEGLGQAAGGREGAGERLRPGSQEREQVPAGILAKLWGPLPGGPTRHRQGERGPETPWDTLRAGSFEDDPDGSRRKDQPSWGLEVKGREGATAGSGLHGACGQVWAGARAADLSSSRLTTCPHPSSPEPPPRTARRGSAVGRQQLASSPHTDTEGLNTHPSSHREEGARRHSRLPMVVRSRACMFP